MLLPTAPKDYDQMLIKIKLQRDSMAHNPNEDEFRSLVEAGLKNNASQCNAKISIEINTQSFNMDKLRTLLNVLTDYELIGWFCLVKNIEKTKSWYILMYKVESHMPKLSWFNKLINKFKGIYYYSIN